MTANPPNPSNLDDANRIIDIFEPYSSIGSIFWQVINV